MKEIILTISFCLAYVLSGCAQIFPYGCKVNDGSLYSLTLHVFRDELKAMNEKEEVWRSNPNVWEKILGKEQYKFQIDSFPHALNMDNRQHLIPSFRLTECASPRVTRALKNDIGEALSSPLPSYEKHLFSSSGWYSTREVLIHMFLICAENCDASKDYNKRIRDNETPLMLAAVLGDVRIVKYLVDHGAKPDEVSGEFYYQDFPHKKILTHAGGETALQYAAKSGYAEIYDYLVNVNRLRNNKT